MDAFPSRYTAGFALTLVLLVGAQTRLHAQTDYYNTDAERPVLVEDAYATELHAFELHLAPLRLERARGGAYTWSLHPELAYGLLPRTQVEVGLPLVLTDGRGEGQEFGPGGVALSLLHNLNAETAGLPALGVRASVVVPAGKFAPDDWYPTLKGVLTRTYRFARVHLNTQYSFGPEPQGAGDGDAVVEGGEEISRWMAGLAVDKAFPLRALLVIGELYAHQPLDERADLAWNAGTGLRYQVSPKLSVDAGVGRRLTGEDRRWFVTFGTGYSFGVRSLIPIPGRSAPSPR